jgi:F-type H+-transporting ATPase subunit b
MQRREVMTQAHAQAAALIEEARASAVRLLEQETQKAVVTAESIAAKARAVATHDHERMLAELKREVGRLVVRAATIATGKILTDDDQRRLTEEAAKQVAA